MLNKKSILVYNKVLKGIQIKPITAPFPELKASDKSLKDVSEEHSKSLQELLLLCMSKSMGNKSQQHKHVLNIHVYFLVSHF